MQNASYELSDFQILQVLGQGSFSKVKLAKRVTDGKLLALKQVNMDKLGMNEKNSALNEIRLLASIKSPYVISYEGSFYSASSNSLCLLMQYAESGDLECLINAQAKVSKMEKGLQETFIWRTLIHLLQGLKTIHENRIVHRDLKSANIFYAKGIAKIGDLNVSSVSDTAFYSTKTGTPYYTAPEIWKGEKYTNNCDIWSLGCIIYEMCALVPPFKAENFPQLFVSVSRGQYKPLSKDYSDDIRTFIRMCLTVDSVERPSASQLLESPILLKKFAEFKEDVSLQGKVELIKPIKCPKALKFINNILPQACQIESPKLSLQTSEKTIKKHKKTVRIDPQQPESRQASWSIKKPRGSTNHSKSKSNIRIKSCSKNKLIHSKSVKSIKGEQQNNYDDVKQPNRIILEPLASPKVIKHLQFKMKSYKKIGDKQNGLTKQ